MPHLTVWMHLPMEIKMPICIQNHLILYVDYKWIRASIPKSLCRETPLEEANFTHSRCTFSNKSWCNYPHTLPIYFCLLCPSVRSNFSHNISPFKINPSCSVMWNSAKWRALAPWHLTASSLSPVSANQISQAITHTVSLQTRLVSTSTHPTVPSHQQSTPPHHHLPHQEGLQSPEVLQIHPQKVADLSLGWKWGHLPAGNCVQGWWQCGATQKNPEEGQVRKHSGRGQSSNGQRYKKKSNFQNQNQMQLIF